MFFVSGTKIDIVNCLQLTELNHIASAGELNRSKLSGGQ